MQTSRRAACHLVERVFAMDKSYLTYPKRGYGQDQEFYAWRMSGKRDKLNWEGDAKVLVSLIIPIEFFPLNPSGVPFKHPGSMVTPYPDLRHFTVRDYGNRVGIYRILNALSAQNLKAGFAFNSEAANRYPPLLKSIQDAGHEIIAHGVSTDHIHHEGLSEAEESSLIIKALGKFDAQPTGWLSPARNQSSRTLALLAKAGLSYHLDWEMDQVPTTMTTENGEITALPNSYEISDFTLLHTRRQSEESWLQQIKDSVELLRDEHDRFGGQMLALTLTPYIMGQPFRIWALREMLAMLANDPDVNVVTPNQINTEFKAQS